MFCCPDSAFWCSAFSFSYPLCVRLVLSACALKKLLYVIFIFIVKPEDCKRLFFVFMAAAFPWSLLRHEKKLYTRVRPGSLWCKWYIDFRLHWLWYNPVHLIIGRISIFCLIGNSVKIPLTCSVWFPLEKNFSLFVFFVFVFVCMCALSRALSLSLS